MDSKWNGAWQGQAVPGHPKGRRGSCIGLPMLTASRGSVSATDSRDPSCRAAFESSDKPVVQSGDTEPISLSDAVRLAAYLRRVAKLRKTDQVMVGIVLLSLLMMVVSAELPPRSTERLVLEGANSACTLLLLVLLVRYHRVYNLLARSTEAVHPSGKQSPELRQSIFVLLEASAARPSTPTHPRLSLRPCRLATTGTIATKPAG